VRPDSAPDHQRIVLLKLTMKLMFLALITALVVVMVRTFLPEDAPPPEPLRVNVAPLGVGGMQGIEWNRQRLLIVHIAEGGHYLVISDYDPIYGCPMNWVPAGSTEAPVQPWPGGLRAICTEHWFDNTGVSLTQGVANLKRLPYTLTGAETLVINAESK
jgi:hypothetical protein